MKSRTTRNDYVIIAGGAGLVFLAGWLLMQDAVSITPLVAIVTAVVMWTVLESMRRTSEQLTRMRKEAFDDYRQVEALISLVATLKPEIPLPPLRDHSASPDLLRHAVNLMLERSPRLSVELGSGSSTVYLAYCLRKIGSGKLISFENDESFAERTRAMLEQHGLTGFATVEHRALQPVQIGGENFMWYSTAGFDHEGIDFVFVDGPPYHVHPLGRYPVLPLMFPHMSTKFAMLLDDADRPEEMRIVSRWKQEHPDLSYQNLEAEKGAVVVSR